jgi:hypothetical protein
VTPQLISIALAGHRWGIGKTKLYELIKYRAFRTVKIGSRRLVDVQSADKFFAEL